MFFDSWQFKSTVYILFLVSCSGQEQVRVCERDYCYERSAERRSSDPNTLREWNRFRNENLERQESTPLKVGQNHQDYTNMRINEFHESREGHGARWTEETYRENPDRVERQTRTDVTRHLAGRTDEKLDFLREFNDQNIVRQHGTLRRVNERDDTNRESDETLRRLDNKDVERRLEKNREEYHESLRQIDERDLSRRSNRDVTLRRLDNRDVKRHSDDNREKHHESLRQINERDFSRRSNRDETSRRLDNRDVKRHSEDNREENHEILSQKEERDLSRRSNRDETLRRLDNKDIKRRSDDNREEHHESLRQIDERDFRRRSNRDETSWRLDNRDVERRLEDNRKEHHESFNQIDERDLSRRSNVARESRRRLSRKEYEPNERRDTNKQLRDISRRSEDSRKERQNGLKVLYDQESELHLVTPSKRSRKLYLDDTERKSMQRRIERHEISRRLNDREIQIRRSDIIRESQNRIERPSQREHDSIQGRENEPRFENREMQNDDSRRSEDKREERQDAMWHHGQNEEVRMERQEISRRLNDREIQIRRSDIIRESQHRIERPSKREHESIRRENRLEPLFENREIQSDNSRHLEDKREERQDALRRRDQNEEGRIERHEISRRLNDREIQIRRSDIIRESQHRIERPSQREHDSIQERENEQRLENREMQSDDSRRSEDKREERQDALRHHGQNEERRVERQEISKRLNDREIQIRRSDIIRESQHRIERPSKREHESIRRENRLEPRFENREIQSDNSRHLEDKREERQDALRRRDQNEEGRIERREISRRINDREIEIRRLDIITEYQHKIERLSQREHESIQRRENRLERRFENPEIQSDDSRSLQNKREERQETLRRLDDREGLQETLRYNRETQLDASRSSDDKTRFSIRIGERLPQRERESNQRLDQTVWKRVDRADQREEHYKIMRQLNEREVSQQVDVARKTQRINRNQIERDLIQRRHENKRETLEVLSRADDRKEINSQSTFIPKQQDSNANRFIQEDYSEKPAIFLSKSYIILGQGAILAYVIMKTLNGKNDFKNQIPIKIHEALEIIGF